MSTELIAQVDNAATEAFAEKVLADYAGANAFFMASIEDRLGLFMELAESGPVTAEELAARTGVLPYGSVLEALGAGVASGVFGMIHGAAALAAVSLARRVKASAA